MSTFSSSFLSLDNVNTALSDLNSSYADFSESITLAEDAYQATEYFEFADPNTVINELTDTLMQGYLTNGDYLIATGSRFTKGFPISISQVDYTYTNTDVIVSLIGKVTIANENAYAKGSIKEVVIDNGDNKVTLLGNANVAFESGYKLYSLKIESGDTSLTLTGKFVVNDILGIGPNVTGTISGISLVSSDQILSVSGLKLSYADFNNAEDLPSFLANLFVTNDVLIGTDTAENLYGFLGNDYLKGLKGDDTLYGNEGNDTLEGGLGNDSLIGGDGDDNYLVTFKTTLLDNTIVAAIEDSISDTDGIDTIKLTGAIKSSNQLFISIDDEGFSEIENLDASATASTKFNLGGNALNNFIIGNTGANAITGALGSDTLDGGKGDDNLEGNEDADSLFGNSGDDSILGGSGSDLIDGGDNNDLLNGGSDADYIFGGAGSDSIEGDLGNDFIDGEAGNDTLLGSEGSDTIFGGTGNDSIDGGTGYNKLEGEDGNDTIWGGNDSNSIEGDAGNDSLVGGSSDDLIEGGIGNDIIYGMNGNDNLDGSEGNDKIDGGNGDDFLKGKEGIDTLTGGNGADIFSFGSPVKATNADIISDFNAADGDKIQLDAYFFSAFLNLESVDDNNITFGKKAVEADDYLVYDPTTGKLYYDTDGVGGKAAVLFATLSNKPATLSEEDFTLIGSSYGSDPVVLGTSAANTWNANNEAPAVHYSYNGLGGNDTIKGHDTISNSLSGGLGNDSITAGNNGDNLFGNEGNDTLIGGNGNDYLAGGDGNDALSAGNGADSLLGGIGKDKLDGGAGDDYLRGDDGNDTLIGGAGEDSLSGGNGNNVMTGGDDADIFIFNRPVLAANASIITDFDMVEDILQLSGDVFRKVVDGVSDDNLAFGTKATSLEHYLIYDNKTGNLYYDADGSGSGKAIKFATLSGKPEAIDADDFQIV